LSTDLYESGKKAKKALKKKGQFFFQISNKTKKTTTTTTNQKCPGKNTRCTIRQHHAKRSCHG
jgi:hypothetical protein